jgi:hypothetical protein
MMRAMDQCGREDDAWRLAYWRVSEELGGSVLPRWGPAALRPYTDGDFGPEYLGPKKQNAPTESRRSSL